MPAKHNIVGMVLGLTIVIDQAVGQPTQRTRGWCSPAIAGVQGNVSITCTGVNPKALERMNRQLAQAQKTLAEKLTAAEEWAREYRDVQQKLSMYIGDEQIKRAKALLDDGRLDEAGSTLDRALEGEDEQIGRLANLHIARGQIYRLQRSSSEAIRQFEIAFRYRRDAASASYLATLLGETGRYTEAENIILSVKPPRTSIVGLYSENDEAAAILLNDLGLIFLGLRRNLWVS